MINLVDYGVTQHAHFRLTSVVIIILLGVTWVAVVTLVNVVAIGYELVPVMSTDFNASYSLWYETLIPRKSWGPVTRTCNGSIIQLTEGIIITQEMLNIFTAVSTNVTGFFSYSLVDFIDERSGTPINGMLYENTVLTDCQINTFGLAQPAYSWVEDQVCTTAFPLHADLICRHFLCVIPLPVK
jgi:hypothetical protein